MIGIYLTQNTTPIIGWISRLLGFIMEGIFNLLSLLGVPSIGLSIILFTIVIYLLMMPLTIKQQKFSKLSAKMNPEIQAIQAKYKNKKDNESLMKMNQETQEVYAKYGVSPTGSCLQLLIQLPILWSLYKVIYAMPAYVGKIKDTFLVLVNKIITSEGGIDYLNNSVNYAIDAKTAGNAENLITAVKNGAMYGSQFKNEAFSSGMNLIQQYVDSGNTAALETALNDGSLSYVQNTIIDVLNKASASELHTIAEKFDATTLQQNGHFIIDQLSASGQVMERGLLETYNNFLGINIANSPSVMVREALATGAWILLIAALAIPLLSALTQWINVKLMPQANNSDGPKSEQAETMASTMKTMNMFMPIMSAFFCYTMPSGLGLYWIAGSVVRSIQQILINKHIDKMDLNDIMQKNQKKSAKKMEKLKKNQERINAYANMNTKNISNGSGPAPSPAKKSTMSEKAKVTQVDREEALKKSTEYYNSGNSKPGSLASKANMVKQYNEKNNK